MSTLEGSCRCCQLLCRSQVFTYSIRLLTLLCLFLKFLHFGHAVRTGKLKNLHSAMCCIMSGSIESDLTSDFVSDNRCDNVHIILPHTYVNWHPPSLPFMCITFNTDCFSFLSIFNNSFGHTILSNYLFEYLVPFISTFFLFVLMICTYQSTVACNYASP